MSNVHPSDEVQSTPLHPDDIIDVPDLTGDNVLDLTQQVRHRMLRQMTTGGKLPMESKDTANLLKLLSDMDKQDLGKKKLVIDEKNVGVNSEVAAAAIALARQLGGSKADPYAIAQTPGTPSAAQAPTLDLSKVIDVDVRPGETDLSPRDFNKDPV